MINLLKFTDSGSFVEWNTMETDRLNEKSDTDDNLVKQLRAFAHVDPDLAEAADRIVQLNLDIVGLKIKNTQLEAEVERLEKELEFYLPSV